MFSAIESGVQLISGILSFIHEYVHALGNSEFAPIPYDKSSIFSFFMLETGMLFYHQIGDPKFHPCA